MNVASLFFRPLPCAAVLCLLNACKPATIDDVAYLWFIAPICANPSEPFGPPPDGFSLIWYERSQGAFSLLVPPVVPYWLALGVTFLGDDIIALKLWLFPFCWLLAAALAALLRRYAPRHAGPLLAMTVLSPALLPSLNVMIDVPALALSLAAVAMFHAALDRRSFAGWGGVIAAGLLAGLAAQTKYTGLTAVAAIGCHAIGKRRWLEGMIAIALSAAVFVGWEWHLNSVYGRSHFLSQVEMSRQRDSGADWLERRASFLVPLVGNLGGLSAGISALLLMALGARRQLLAALLAAQIGFLLLLALIPDRWAVFVRNSDLPRDEVSLSTIWAGCTGLVFVGLLGVVVLRAIVRGRWQSPSRRRRGSRVLFLVCWLGVEVIASLAMSPFMAVRRCLGILVVATLLAGWLLSRARRTEDDRRLVVAIAWFGIACGFLFAAIDHYDAWGAKRAVRAAANWIVSVADEPRETWFTGHWGFQFEAERRGWRPVDPGTSTLAAGDWLVIPTGSAAPYAQGVQIDPNVLTPIAFLEWREGWPLHTSSDFYDGNQPLRRAEDRTLRLTIYRVRQTFRAEPP